MEPKISWNDNSSSDASIDASHCRLSILAYLVCRWLPKFSFNHFSGKWITHESMIIPNNGVWQNLSLFQEVLVWNFDQGHCCDFSCYILRTFISFDVLSTFSLLLGDFNYLESSEWTQENFFFSWIVSECISRKFDMWRWFVIATQVNLENDQLTMEIFLIRVWITKSVLIDFTGSLERCPHANRILFVIIQIEIFIFPQSSKNWLIEIFVWV